MARAAGEPPPPLPEGPRAEPEVLLVYRDPESLEGRVVRGTPRLLFALKMLHEGLSCAEAGIRAGRDEAYAREALEAARRQGLAVGPGDVPRRDEAPGGPRGPAAPELA